MNAAPITPASLAGHAIVTRGPDYSPMSFPSLLFDQLIRELGEMVSVRDQALRRPELTTSAAVTAALEALKDAVVAVGEVAQVGDREAEVATARRALGRARVLFGEVTRLLRSVPMTPDGNGSMAGRPTART